MRTGLLAEFDSPAALLVAIGDLRAMGYSRLETFTPYPVDGLNEALGLGRSKLPRLVFGGGLVGLVFAYALQLWTTAVDYRLDVGDRPLHSAPAFIPITFETTVLFAALTAFAAPLLLNGLPRLWHPVSEADGIESATVDGYWVGIDRSDARLDETRSEAHLRELGATRVVPVGPLW